MQLIKSDKSSTNVLQSIREGDEKLLRALYESNRMRFIKWFEKHHQISKHEAAELYQKAFTTFYLNMKDGKIEKLNSSIPTYLFGIGKNLVKEIFREKKRSLPLEDVNDSKATDYEYQEQLNQSHNKTMVEEILRRLGDPCKSLLIMYYFKNFSMESIAQNLGYKNEGVVKKKKCLCLKKIREEFHELKKAVQ